MPSPVSPDAGVPEHQPDQRRQNSPWPGGQPPSGPFAASRPQSGQFAARPGSGQEPPEPGWPATGPVGTGNGDSDDRRRTNNRRDWIWSVVAFLVAATVIGAVGFYFFGPDSTEATSATWAIDSCAGPDPAAENTEAETYRPLACTDPGATVTVLDIQDAVSVGQLHCPEGADIVFQKDGNAGGETQAVCARNLSDDHPGDPGMGGGQLMTGDCVDRDGREVACSSDGALPVTGLMVGGVECPEGTKDELQLGFDAQRSYETICLGA